jgi:AraC family transcriptional regulator, regulatory protein of adaptative response / methylphosphotriester-DNA alkyltransferase methyltransferase
VRGVAVENPNSVLDHYARGQRRSTQELHASLLRETAEIVRAEFGRPLTLEEVARRLATSPRQLRRIFTEAGGKSFRSLLTEVRMDRAAELLEATDLSVSEVGRRVGYREAGQFTKAFKRAHAATPSEFRVRRRALSRSSDGELVRTGQDTIRSYRAG